MLVSLCVETEVSAVLLLVAVSDEGPVVDCGGLQAPMAANTITNAKKMFFINYVWLLLQFLCHLILHQYVLKFAINVQIVVIILQ